MWSRFRKAIPALIVLAMMLGMLQVLSMAKIIHSFVLPAPAAVFSALITQKEILWLHCRETLTIASLGFYSEYHFGNYYCFVNGCFYSSVSGFISFVGGLTDDSHHDYYSCNSPDVWIWGGAAINCGFVGLFSQLLSIYFKVF